FLMAALRLFVMANIVGLVIRVFVGLGLYFFVMEPLGDTISDMLSNRFGALPPEVAGWVGYLQVDVYVQAILSAYTVVWASNYVLRMRTA
ncbi:MAG: hypothetical protein ACK50G_03670, partial [bacterium]